MKKNAILLTTLALVLAACGSSNSPSAAVPGTPVATTPTTDASAAPATTLAARLGRTPGHVLSLPDLSVLQRGNDDTSAPDVIVRYTQFSDVQTLAQHLGATLSGVIPELHAALLTLPSTLSGSKVALSVSAGGTLSVTENGHIAQLSPVPVADSGSATLALNTQGLNPQALADSDPLSPKQWWIRQVKADQVRGIATGKGVIVGVVDDDLDRQHEDLKADGKIVTGLDTTDVSTEHLLLPTDPLTNGDHGSGSAGTIAERIGNGVGGAGVAPDAVLMPIRIFNPRYTGSFNVAYGMVWAVKHNAQVLNNSWGGGGYEQIIKDATDYALLYNVTVVGSAGNDNRDLHNGLEAYPGVISVGASGGDDLKTDFSNNGPRVDLYAPGDAGLTTYINDTLKSPARESSYGLFGGTSMAGPVVAGGAALVIEKAKQLGLTLTPYQIKRLLADNGDLMKDPRVGVNKRLNLVKSLNFTASSLPSDGGYVGVKVTDLVNGDAIDGTDVILTPLNGQNKGLDYLSQTSTGGYGVNSKGGFGNIFGDDIGAGGVAGFVGVEPGDYMVQMAGPSVFGYSGSRTVLSRRISVPSGIKGADGVVTNPVVVRVQHQVDTFELTAKGRNGAPASSSDLTVFPPDFFTKNLVAGTFDNAYLSPAYPKTKASAAAPDGTPDQDFYKFVVPAGKTLTVASYANKVGSNSVAKVQLVDDSGAAVAGSTSAAAAASSDADYVAKYAATTDTTVYIKLSSANDSYGLGSWYGLEVGVK